MDREIRKLAWQLAAHARVAGDVRRSRHPAGARASGGRRLLPELAAGAAAPLEETRAAGRSAGRRPKRRRRLRRWRTRRPRSARARRSATASAASSRRAAPSSCSASAIRDARLMFVGEGPGPRRGPAGRAVRRPRRAAAHRDHHQGHEAAARGRLHRQRRQVPAAGEPQPGAGRDRRPARRSCARQIELVQPRGDRRARQVRRADAARDRRRRSPGCAAAGSSYHGVPLMPTFHPAYLLRNPGDKRLVWEDIKSVMARARAAAPDAAAAAARVNGVARCGGRRRWRRPAGAGPDLARGARPGRREVELLTRRRDDQPGDRRLHPSTASTWRRATARRRW